MTQTAIQTSFASGEWAPKLRSRVDIARYRSGAALLRNFYVDFSGGGASTRPGTRYINQCRAPGARLVSFQPSVNISYVLEFGQNYIRFFSNGAPILENPVTVLGAIPANPIQLNNSGNWKVGDWLFIQGFQGLVAPGGTTSILNNNYWIVSSIVGPNITLTDLQGNPVNASTWSAYVPGSGTASRVYTISSPYAASDLFPNQSTGNPGIKWVQDVTSMIICHPSYPPQILTIISANNWTLSAINFAPSISAPSPSGFAIGGAGTGWFYSYVVTAVDNNGQESVPSVPVSNGGAGGPLIQATNPSNLNFGWGAISGAVSYNVYKASPQSTTAVGAGAQYGFVGNVRGTGWKESYPGISPDFSQTPPIAASPIVGGNVISLNLVGSITFVQVPNIFIGAAPAGGFTATGYASLQVVTAAPNGALFIHNNVTPTASPIGVTFTLTNGVVIVVQAATFSSGSWSVSQIGIASPGSITGGGTPTPTNPVVPTSMSTNWTMAGPATGFNLTWQVGSLILIQGGFGYTSAPAVSSLPAGVSATTTISPISQAGSGVLGAAPVGNPRVPAFFQQRLTLASPNAALQTFYMSQPGGFFNYNTTNPAQADNAITASIVSEDLNDIRSLIPVPTGLLALTGKGAWLINGGGGISTANPITPSNVSATPQAFNGANDVRPLKVQMDALYVTNKGNYVRDANYNIYANIFTGQDITAISNHLFFGYSIIDWTWAEEPFKTVWSVRSDGQLLSLAYVKEPGQEQALVGWGHHDTNGFFTSICSVIETVDGNTVDAVYMTITRLVNGGYFTLVERLADRYFPYGYEDSWSVDCALQTKPAVVISNGGLNTAGGVVGTNVTVIDPIALPFTAQMATENWIIRAGGGIYKIITFTNPGQVTATVLRTPSQINLYNGIPRPQASYTIWQPTTTVSGLLQLVGQSVTGVADGAVVGPLIVSGTGSVTLPNSATKVTLGLSFTPQLKTLPLDLGEPTIQAKRKKIAAVTLRVADTLGLQIGKTFSTLVSMKDFQIGAVPSTSSGVVKVTDLVNPSNDSTAPFIDGRTIIDQDWESAGNYCIQQNLPYPATILGVMPEIQIGDTGK